MANVSARRPRVGISACLLGQEVRWDGRHKRDRWIAEELAAQVDLVAVCPELEVGLGVPREPIRLVGDPSSPRLVSEGGVDLTSRMEHFVDRRTRELAGLDLCGYVLKKNSPSCGLEGVPVHPTRADAPAPPVGSGLFARGLARRLPLLPVEEEGGLQDPARRDHFLERIFACARWNEARAERMDPAGLARFHTSHELQLLAHHPAAGHRLGSFVARVKANGRPRAFDAYGRAFARVLRIPATRQSHTWVLKRITALLEPALLPEERVELEAVVHRFAQGEVPRQVPVEMIAHHAERHGVGELAVQTYLHPDPRELSLRSEG